MMGIDTRRKVSAREIPWLYFNLYECDSQEETSVFIGISIVLLESMLREPAYPICAR